MEIILNTTFTQPGLPVDVIADTFIRADSSSPGVTERGAIPWVVEATANVAAWEAAIVSNQLSVRRTSAATATERAFATVDSGRANGSVEMKINVMPGGAATQSAFLVARYVNPLNHLMVMPTSAGVWALYKRENGVGTMISAGDQITAVQGQVVSVALNGTGVVVYVNGVPAVRRVDVPEFVNATRFGAGVAANSGQTVGATRFDDFQHIGG